jgi:N-acylneuraminate cytidylyltransferase
MSIPEKPLAIIPARGSSKRFPRKNIAILAGKPLIAYAIEAARDSEIFDQVCVSSEDDEILEIAEQWGAQAVLKRPAELADDLTSLKEVCAYLLESFSLQGREYREFGLLLVTNPLRISADLRQAYQLFKNENAAICMSLVPFSHPPQRAVRVNSKSGLVEPYFGIENMTQTQLLEPLYRHDGSIIFAKSEVFLTTGEFYGPGVIPYFIPPERSVDIDSPLELAWAEFLMKRDSFPRAKKRTDRI